METAEFDDEYTRQVRSGDLSAHLRALVRHQADTGNAPHENLTLWLLASALHAPRGGGERGETILRPASYCTDPSLASGLLDLVAHLAPPVSPERRWRSMLGVLHGVACIDIEGLKLGAQTTRALEHLAPQERAAFVGYLAIYNQSSPLVFSEIEAQIKRGDTGQGSVDSAVRGLLTVTSPPQRPGDRCEVLLDAVAYSSVGSLDAAMSFVQTEPTPGTEASARQGRSPSEGQCVGQRDRLLDRIEAAVNRLPVTPAGTASLPMAYSLSLGEVCRQAGTPAAARARAARIAFELLERSPSNEAIKAACECDKGKAAAKARQLGRADGCAP